MLYPLYPDGVDIMCQAGAMAAVEDCGLPVTVAEARAMINRALAESQLDWMVYLLEYGSTSDQLHAAYHKRLDHTLIQPYPSLSKYFMALGDQAAHVMLTHSAHEWAVRTIEHIQLRPWFPDERILAWEQYKAHKSHSTKGFEMALEKLGVTRADQVVFADDSAVNLVIAKKMGITTVWVSHARALPAEQSVHVDHVVKNIEVFMKQQVALLGKDSPRP
jgi:putative hydrolase of the HAD superfamily